jgi:hypothetical protein
VKICPSCNEKNANRNSWCGECGTRIREIPDGLKRDIAFIISENARRKRKRTIAVAGLIISVLGCFGYSWISHMIATTVKAQVEALRPAIAREANVRAEEMLNRELPKTLGIAMNAAAERFVDGAQKISQQKNRRLEIAYADALRDLKAKTQSLAVSYQTTVDGATQRTAQSVALARPINGGFYSDAIVSSTTPSVSGLFGLGSNYLSDNVIKSHTLSDPLLSSITSTSIITQTTYSPACIGNIPTLVVDAAGSHFGKPEDCKNQPTIGGAVPGADLVFPPTKP